LPLILNKDFTVLHSDLSKGDYSCSA